nr:DUF6076 domain-containing protein [uncultured Dorea sp.]
MYSIKNLHIALSLREQDYSIGITSKDTFFLGDVIATNVNYGEFIRDFLNIDLSNIMGVINPIVTTPNLIDEYLDSCFSDLFGNDNEILIALILNTYHSMLLELLQDNSTEIINNVKLFFHSLCIFQLELIKCVETFKITPRIKTVFSQIQNINAYLNFDQPDSFDFVYQINDIYTLLAIDFKKVLEKSILIKKCANCGKYFIPSNRSDEIYCDNIFRLGKTCKQVGYEEKEKKDPFKVLYTKARKTQHARIRYNIKNKPNYKEDHYIPWRMSAEKARDHFKSLNDIDGFKQWIEDNKDSF